MNCSLPLDYYRLEMAGGLAGLGGIILYGGLSDNLTTGEVLATPISEKPHD